MNEPNPQVQPKAKAPAQLPTITEAKLLPVPMVGLARGMGNIIDLSSVVFLALIPVIYDIATNGIISKVTPNFECLVFMAKHYGASITGLALIATPIPIIYLRLFFKRIVRSPTLGETIVGFTSDSIAPGFEGVKQESLYGLHQWLISVYAYLFAFIATFTFWGLTRATIEILAPGAKAETLLGSFPILANVAYMLCCFVVSYIAALSFGFQPRSRTDLTSYSDRCCKLTVKHLRQGKIKKRTNEISVTSNLKNPPVTPREI